MNAHSPGLASIVRDAQYLDERLASAAARHRCDRALGGLGERRLATWRSRLGVPDDLTLRRHLPASWNWQDVEAVLSGADGGQPDEVPRWAVTLSRMIRAVKEDPDPELASDEAELPFAHLLRPIACLAQREVRARVDAPAWKNLFEQAHRDLRLGLVASLGELMADCLHHEFSARRDKGAEFLGRMLGNASPRSDAVYRDFVSALRADGMEGLFARYPVLARLAASAVDQWTDAVSEFLSRLAADLPDLEEVCGRTGTFFVRVEPGLSDPHDHGRSVIVAIAEDGWRIVYKPRSLAPEAAWRDLLRLLDPDLADATPRVVDRGGYGWMEYAAYRGCDDAQEVERFFTRIGTILCAAYLFGGKDFHCDNLIACGQFPVLVDLETLGQPDPVALTGVDDWVSRATRNRDRIFWSSVMRAEFLPRWQSSGGREATDESALSCPADHVWRRMCWHAANTDFMHKAWEEKPGTPRNLPTLAGTAVRSEEHVDAIAHGFETAWTKLMDRRGTLLAGPGPLDAFRRMPFRFVFRATATYYGVQRKALSVETLTNGVDFSLELEALRRAIVGTDGGTGILSLVDAEIQALARGDIPRFGALTDEKILSHGVPAPIADCFETTGFDAIVNRLSGLSTEELDHQLRCLRTVFYGEKARTYGRGSSQQPGSSDRGCADGSVTLTKADALEHACRIGEEVCRSAFSAGPGRLGWVGLAYRSTAGGFEANPLDDSLYEGNAGIAVFLAALHRATGEAMFRTASLSAVGDLRDFIRSVPESARGTVVSKYGIGAAGGIGGQIYALVRIADLLGEPSLIKDAERLSAWVTDEAIARDGEHDVLGGSAGAIAGLLALHARAGRDEILSRASACGLHLIGAAAGVSTTGAGSFGHGSFGIAALLARLGDRAGRCEFGHVARRIFACDTGDAEVSPNGPHGTGSTCCRIGWCNGTAGTGLALLDALPRHGGPAVARGIEAAAVSVAEHWGAGTDQACCGAFGGIEFLARAGRSMNKPEWEDDAWRIAASVVSRAGRAGGFRLLPGVPCDYWGPSFFQGVAGIGYGLLRLADPDAFPSILALE